MTLDSFTRAYIACALWSSSDEDDNRKHGRSDDAALDRSYDESDLSGECRAKMAADCKAFQRQNAEDLAESGLDDEQAGHDFWLTRNGHGAGFWDRGLPKALGQRLTDACKAFGSCDLIVGDDGQIHVM